MAGLLYSQEISPDLRHLVLELLLSERRCRPASTIELGAIQEALGSRNAPLGRVGLGQSGLLAERIRSIRGEVCLCAV
jgi:hypothetical protein